MKELLELWYTLLGLLILATTGGLICAALWFLVPGPRHRLLPLQRRRLVPWSGSIVWFSFCVMALLPMLIHQLLIRSGLFTAIYGGDANTPGLLERQALWSMAFAYGAGAVVLVLLLRLTLGVRLAQLGLTRVRAVQNVVGGYLVWLVVAPLALLLYWLVTLFMTPQVHPLQRAGQQPLLPAEWGLVVFGAVVAAPLLEEVVFRGLLLSWQTGRAADAQWVVAVGALVVSIFFSSDREGNLNPWPPLFVAAMLPGMLLVPLMRGRLRGPTATAPPSPGLTSPAREETQEEGGDRPPVIEVRGPAIWSSRIRRGLAAFARLTAERRVRAGLAIYSNALLFAAFHSRIWPSPIPLFPLSIGLAWLAYRTQSLIGPLVVHALFNAVACLVIFLSQ